MKHFVWVCAVFVALASAGARAQLPPGTQDATAPAKASPEDGLLTEANDALEKGDDARAVTALTKLTAEGSAHASDTHLLFDLGYAEDGLGHSAAAEAAYRRATAADAKYFEAHLALGLLLAREEKLPEARVELLTAVGLASVGLPADNPALVARAYRALAHIDIGINAADARDELLAALKLTPETTDDELLAAETAESLEDYPSAEGEYRRLVAADPKNLGAIAGLAHVLVKEKKTAEAETLLTGALAEHPNDPALTAQLAGVYAAESDPGQVAKAVPLVEALHAQRPDDLTVTRLLARLYTKAGAPDKAEPLYRALVKQFPNEPELQDALGSTLMHLSRYPEAEEVLKQAVATPNAFQPGDLADAYTDLAIAASENKDPTTVLHTLQLRATIAPKTAGALFLEATSYDKLRQEKQAIEAYKEFLTVSNGKFPDQEWEARHRLVTLEHTK
jgi:Flp pilus assembly protein TadD